jgi:fructokinase
MNLRKDILIFGEVLFDVFGAGEEKLGGAPFNVAWHLKGFGLDPLFISGIGQDKRGKRVLKLMTEWNMDKRGLYINEKSSTGVVNVFIDKKGPTFDIPFGQAFDHININDLSLFDITDIEPFLYHGSLALRSEENFNVLKSIKEMLSPEIFVDINLRTPWWKKEKVLKLIREAKWLKLNDIEFNELFNSNIDKVVLSNICYHFGLDSIILTKGEEGAEIFAETGCYLKAKNRVEKNIVDTVGAGDAFSAVFIYGLINKWDYNVALSRAVNFATDICMIRGALPSDIKFYKKHLDEWSKEDE